MKCEQKIWKPIMAIVTFLAMQLIGGAIASTICHMMRTDGSANAGDVNGQDAILSPETLAWATTLSGVASVIAIYKILRMIRPVKAFQVMGLTRKRNRMASLMATVAAMTGIVGTDLLSEQIALPNLMEEQFLDMSQSVIGIISIAIVAPIVEELIFREGIEGFLLREGIKPWVAIFCSASAFGIIHMNPAQIPFAFLIGLILGIIYWKTGNIVLCSLLHIANNSVALFEMNMLGEAANDMRYSEFIGGGRAAWMAIGTCTLICVGLLCAFCKEYKVVQKGE